MMNQQQSSYTVPTNPQNAPVISNSLQSKIISLVPKIIGILGIIQIILSLLIFGMELGIVICFFRAGDGDDISWSVRWDGFGPLTFAGFWVSAVSDFAVKFLSKLSQQLSDSTMWTKNVIAQIIHLIFIFILIGISGNYVSNHSLTYLGYSETGVVASKYRLHQAQLAFAILMLFSIIIFLGLYAYLNFVVRNFYHLLTPVQSTPPSNYNHPPAFQHPVPPMPMPMPHQQYPPAVDQTKQPPPYMSPTNMNNEF